MTTNRRFAGLLVWVLASLVMLTLLIACASFTKNSYRTLVLSDQTYDATFTTLGELYKEGKITEDEKKNAVELGRVYKSAHNNAVDAVAAYEEAGGYGETSAVEAAILKASDSLADLLSYYRKIKEE